MAKGNRRRGVQGERASCIAAGAYEFTAEQVGATGNKSLLRNMIPFNFMTDPLTQKTTDAGEFTLIEK